MTFNAGVEEATVARRVACRGLGLHGGDDVEIALNPAALGTGIVFEVASTAGSAPVEIPARFASVVSATRATCLTDGRGTTVSTVEHLLAALFALRIDNVRIDVLGSEIPMMDGSALPLVEWIRSAGRVEQGRPRLEYDLVRSFEVREGERSIRIEPDHRLSVSYAIDFDHPCIGRQSVCFPQLDESCFEREIAGARTFGFEREIELLRASGLALGGSFENAIVLGDAEVLNASGLRWPDEFVRHKVIDLLGDLSLLGARLNGRIFVERGGHGLHHRLVEGLLESVGLLVPTSDRSDPALHGEGRAQSLA